MTGGCAADNIQEGPVTPGLFLLLGNWAPMLQQWMSEGNL
jgi:hypothetical protein